VSRRWLAPAHCENEDCRQRGSIFDAVRSRPARLSKKIWLNADDLTEGRVLMYEAHSDAGSWRSSTAGPLGPIQELLRYSLDRNGVRVHVITVLSHLRPQPPSMVSMRSQVVATSCAVASGTDQASASQHQHSHGSIASRQRSAAWERISPFSRSLLLEGHVQISPL
jgi:hypothetical protein